MKNILLLVHDDGGQEARLQTALDVARGLDAHLTCLDVTQLPVIVDDGMNSIATAMLLEDERARETTNRERLEARLANEDVAWDWIDVTGSITECIIAVSALADLIIVNRKIDSNFGPDMRSITGTIAIQSHRPLVAVPDDLRTFATGGMALIAWDGSAPVIATMRASIPLLKLASSVHIFTVRNGSETVDAEEAAVYLSRYDIHASVRRIESEVKQHDELINTECATINADYCLMGAYGHSRIREALFGGVTRRMLTTSALPLILGH
jgi:nucleotide-binding universal stress UspA family protein